MSGGLGIMPWFRKGPIFFDNFKSLHDKVFSDSHM